jgi:hypothetical protein
MSLAIVNRLNATIIGPPGQRGVSIQRQQGIGRQLLFSGDDGLNGVSADLWPLIRSNSVLKSLISVKLRGMNVIVG